MRKIFTTAAFTALLAVAAGPGHAGWDEGVAAFKAGNYTKAAAEFQTLAEQQPSCAQCHLMLGQSLLKLNRSQDAVNALRKAYEANPSDNAVRLPLALAYLESKRYDDALQLLKTIDPNTLSKDKQQAYYQYRAHALSSTGRSDQLLDDLRRLAQSSPNDAAAQRNYGRAALAAQDIDAAVTALEAAARLEPDQKTRQELVNALKLKGRQSSGSAKVQVYQRAAQVAQQLVGASGSYDNLMLLGEAQLGGKQYAAAVTTFDRAVKANAGDWLALYYLGQAQTQTNAFAEAERNLKAALGKAKSSQNETLVWKQLGYVYEKQKNYDEAKMAYRKVGDAAGVARVESNQAIAAENQEAEQFNSELEKLEEEKRQLEEQMRDLPPSF